MFPNYRSRTNLSQSRFKITFLVEEDHSEIYSVSIKTIGIESNMHSITNITEKAKMTFRQNLESLESLKEISIEY